MKLSKVLVALTVGVVAFSSCKKKGCTDPIADNYNVSAEKDDGSCEFSSNPQAPSKYVFQDANGNSTVSYSGQTERLNQLREMVVMMKTGTTQTISAQNLKDMYANTGDNGNGNFSFSSTKQLENKTFATDAAFFKAAMDSIALASQSFGTTASNGTAGTLTNGTKTYLFSQNGIEYAQVIEKGLMGACFMYQALNVYFGADKMNVDNTNAVDAANGKYYTTMEHHFDEAFGYMGVSTDFPTVIPDDLWGEYINKQNTSLGANANLMNNFLNGRFAITQKDIAARDVAINNIRVKWEQVAGRQAIDYMGDAISNWGTDNTLAFHQLSEAYAFVYCLRYAPTETRVMSQAEVLAVLAQFGENFWELSLTDLNAIKLQLEAKY